MVVLEARRLLQRVRLPPARARRPTRRCSGAAGRRRPPTCNVSLQAGTTLGGGTTINWTNCLRTKPWVREQWATEHGLEGVDGAEYDRHLDAVLERIGATDKCSDLNGPHQRMKEGAEQLGWSFRHDHPQRRPRQVPPRRPATSASATSRARRTPAEKTWLRDAVEQRRASSSCARRAQRVLIEDGRAAGVEADLHRRRRHRGAPRDRARADRRRRLRLARVARAAAALGHRRPGRRQLPAAAPGVGRHRRTTASDQQAWWGAAAGRARRRVRRTSSDGYGFLIEARPVHARADGSAIAVGRAPRRTRTMLDGVRRGASFVDAHARPRPRPGRRSTRTARPCRTTRSTDPLDVANMRTRPRGARAAARGGRRARDLTLAARAADLAARRRPRRASSARARRQPLRAGGIKLFSAHQMGTCRMGSDPATSRRRTRAASCTTRRACGSATRSAFPTSPGTNPMITIMALAHRTAEAITGVGRRRAAAADARAGDSEDAVAVTKAMA